MNYTFEIKPDHKIIVIVGLAGTGKTSLVEQILKEHEDCQHSIYHTDDYQHFGFEQSVYALRNDIAHDENPLKIIEGVQGYRLLRKGLQMQDFFADVVITTVCGDLERHDRLYGRPDGNKKDHAAFDKACFKVWQDYLALAEQLNKVPQLETIDTSSK